MWFAYLFDANPFKREMPIALIATAIIFSVTFYLDPFGLLSYPLHIVGQFWNAMIFLRKAAWAGNSETVKNRKDSNSFIRSFSGMGPQLLQPANRQSKMFRDFSGWGFILSIVWINVNLFYLLGPDWIRSPFFQYTHHPLLYFAILYPAIVYLNYAQERTSFQAKLIGVVLCVLLTLLGLLPFIFFGVSLNLGEYEQNILRSIVALMPISTLIIIFVLPLFFKYNLLKPLNRIVDGVKKVNAGELQTSVSVEVKDELGSLASHFNEMTNSLRQYAHEMEVLVARRTDELTKSLKELKAAQKQLVQKEKMASLGELTAGIAHEIQNPLNFVNNFSDLNIELIQELEQETDKGNITEVKYIANNIKENERKISEHGKRAGAIVKGMLQHSRASTGRKEPTDINALADEYLRLSYYGLRAKDKDFDSNFMTNFHEGIGRIEVVPQDIGRVLLNLYNNAFYAVNEKRKLLNGTFEPIVEVSTKRVGDKVEITVRDNGTGIPQKVVEKIFQPFFTTKPTGKGTGLGLSLSYDIIKAHSGEIKVESIEGEGASFIIHLPLQS
jgi:signal transduction histidine kinase